MNPQEAVREEAARRAMQSAPPPVAGPPSALGWPVPPDAGLRELLQTDLDRGLTQKYFGIDTDKEFALAQLLPWQEESVRRKGDLADMEHLFSLPPPGSRFRCNMRGQLRQSIDSVQFLPRMASWRMAHVSRGRDGFERRQQRTSTILNRQESGDGLAQAQAARPMMRPPLMARVGMRLMGVR